MKEERSVIFMESLESILGCNWSEMEEIASWTEEDGRGGSGVFFSAVGFWFNIFKGWFAQFVILGRLKLFLIISVIIWLIACFKMPKPTHFSVFN